MSQRLSASSLVSWVTSLCLALGGLITIQISSVHARIGRPITVISKEQDQRLRRAHCGAPQWSPDGTEIAVAVYRPKQESREVWVYGLSSGLRITRTEQVLPLGVKNSRLGGKPTPVIEFSWAPGIDPPYVFSSKGLNRKNFDIYVDGGWITEANQGNDGYPVFSPDSNYLAYTSQQQESGDIMMIDFTRDDFAPLRLTNTPHATEYIPQWHPSLPSLIFIRSQKSRGQDLVVIDNVRDPSARDLTNWSKDEIRPSWSPDGTKVAFYSNQKSSKDQVFDLWVINADGSNPKRLVKDVVVDEHQGPAWTDNSKNILYVKRDFDRANPIRWVNVINRRGGLITQETQLNSDLSAHYGDDGVTYLAYYARGHVNSEDKSWKRIFVVSFRTSDLR